MQGDHPAAKKTPTRNDRPKASAIPDPAAALVGTGFSFRIGSGFAMIPSWRGLRRGRSTVCGCTRTVRSRKGRRIRPIVCTPRTITATPPIQRTYPCAACTFVRNWPTAMPRTVKTTEKPRTKNTPCQNKMRRGVACPCPRSFPQGSRDSRELSGSTHGETNESSPPTKAISAPISSDVSCTRIASTATSNPP